MTGLQNEHTERYGETKDEYVVEQILLLKFNKQWKRFIHIGDVPHGYNEKKERKKQRERVRRREGSSLIRSSLFMKVYPFRILVNWGFIMTTINQSSYGSD